MSINFPTNTKDTIDQIREAVGRDIEIHYTLEGITCPDCTVDSITGMSDDPFCTTCNGLGRLDSPTYRTVLAHVLWTSVDTRYNLPAGRIRIGDCVVTIEYDEDLITPIETSNYFLVDDKELYLVGYDLRGVPEINRISISLKENPRDGRI